MATAAVVPNRVWLDAHYDAVARLYTFPQCVDLVDLHSDGQNRLVVADLGTGATQMKLKVYRDTSLSSEHALTDVPTSIAAFYNDVSEPKTPAVAVASASSIFIYKNLRPFYKFSLPPSEVSQAEVMLWRKMSGGEIELSGMIDGLTKMRGGEGDLSARSQTLLSLSGQDKRLAFVEKYRGVALTSRTSITTLATLNKTHPEPDAIKCLVAGTEDQHLIIIDTQAFNVLKTVRLPHVPSHLSASGVYDVAYVITVATRNSKLCSIDASGQKLFEIDVKSGGIVDVVHIERRIAVAGMDRSVCIYTEKGVLQSTLKLPESPLCLSPLIHKSKGLKCLLVALANRTVALYNGEALIDTLQLPDTASMIRFGRYGREDNALIIITRGGALIIKILRRAATLTPRDAKSESGEGAKLAKLNIPKRTKLYVDQMQREKEHAKDIHAQFQHGLTFMRLRAARQYLQVVEKDMIVLSASPGGGDAEPIKISCKINGLGPTFKLWVSVSNTSLNQPCDDLIITYNYNAHLYHIESLLQRVNRLPPADSFDTWTIVKCITDQPTAEPIRVLVCREGGVARPLLMASVEMPISVVDII